MKKPLIAATMAGMMLFGIQAQASSQQIVDSHHQYRAYLVPLDESGVKATITMIPISPKKTRVIAEMTGKNRDSGLHLALNHGLCRDQNNKQAFALNPFKNGKSETVISATPDKLFGETLAFYATKPNGNASSAVACGNMP